jgi:predicted nucleotidyltransferase
MNIHTTDKNLVEALKSATIASCQIGSTMYGTNDENSDVDILHIYATSTKELNSLFPSFHQIQYTENGVDYLFVSIHNFIKNLITGDSTINFEVVQSGALHDTRLEFLYANKNEFNTYKMIRSYLGFANRDVKMWNGCKNDRDRHKKLMHIMRGYYYAKGMIDGDPFEIKNAEWIEAMSKIEGTGKELQTYVTNYGTLVKELRTKINNGDELGLAKYMDVSAQTQIDYCFSLLCDSSVYKLWVANIDMYEDLIELFYETNENGVEY